MPPTTTQMSFASSLSDAPDTGAAIDEVLAELTRTLEPPVDVAFVFASAHHADSFEQIHRHLSNGLKPRTALGVTAEGVLGRGRELERQQPGLSILAATLPDVRVHAFSYDELDWAPLIESPQALSDQIGVAPQDARAILMLADPFSTPMVKLLPTLASAYGGVPVAGGMASGGGAPEENRLLLSGRVLRAGAVGVVLSGAVDVECTVSQGCRPIGRPCVITKSQRNIVQQLGGRSALAVVQELLEQLNEEDRDLVQTKGLLIGRVINEYKERFGRGDFLIKNIMGVDQDRGFVAIGDPQVRVGQTVQLHVRDQRTAEEDFMLLLEAQKLHGPGAGGLLFSCNGRGTNLFDHADADAQMVQGALGDMPLAGFFAAGEIGPVGDQPFLHGHTASLVVFRPKGLL